MFSNGAKKHSKTTIKHILKNENESISPEDIELAIKMLVNTLYERREDVVVGTIVADFPLGVKALLMPYKTYNWFGA